MAFALVSAMTGIVLYREVFGPPEVVWRSNIRDADRLIAQIESFRQNRGRLPAGLSEVSESAAGQDRFFYEKCDGTHYIVWFGTRLGESMTYDSLAHDWKELNRGCH